MNQKNLMLTCVAWGNRWGWSILESSKHREEQKFFSDNLKMLRKSKGFTQEELAIKVNVVRQTVSKWEKGLSVPDAVTLQKIAEVLDVSVNELLGAEKLH